MFRLLLLLLLISSCQKEVADLATKNEFYDKALQQFRPLNQFESPRPNLKYVGDLRIDILLNYLAAQDRVEGEQVGFSGTSSEIYQVYLKLKGLATLHQLTLMLHHQSPNVRYYALLALGKRDPDNKKTYYKSLEGKLEQISFLNGCIESTGELWELASYALFESIE